MISSSDSVLKVIAIPTSRQKYALGTQTMKETMTEKSHCFNVCCNIFYSPLPDIPNCFHYTPGHKKIKIKKDEQGAFGLFRPYYYWIIFNMPPLKKISGCEVLRFLKVAINPFRKILLYTSAMLRSSQKQRLWAWLCNMVGNIC